MLQIDGSTLRTLCMQHGPLMSFNLYLYQGFALAKYSSREEAKKVSFRVIIQIIDPNFKCYQNRKYYVLYVYYKYFAFFNFF